VANNITKHTREMKCPSGTRRGKSYALEVRKTSLLVHMRHHHLAWEAWLRRSRSRRGWGRPRWTRRSWHGWWPRRAPTPPPRSAAAHRSESPAIAAAAPISSNSPRAPQQIWGRKQRINYKVCSMIHLPWLPLASPPLIYTSRRIKSPDLRVTMMNRWGMREIEERGVVVVTGRHGGVAPRSWVCVRGCHTPLAGGDRRRRERDLKRKTEGIRGRAEDPLSREPESIDNR